MLAHQIYISAIYSLERDELAKESALSSSFIRRRCQSHKSVRVAQTNGVLKTLPVGGLDD